MSAQAILELIENLHTLKMVSRSGWRIRGIKEAESVADHCYRMATLAMVLADWLVANGVEVDAPRVMRMALVHEFGEAKIGDIPYPAMRFIPDELKHNAERGAVESMTAGLDSVGQMYLSLWDEFEAGETLEAKIVRAADKLEMMVQVTEYEHIGYTCLSDFWQNVKNVENFDAHPVINEIWQLLAKKHADNS